MKPDSLSLYSLVWSDPGVVQQNTVATIAALRGLNPARADEPREIVVRGYSKPNDGGGTFAWSPDNTATTSMAKPDNKEGRVFCAETKDGGLTWQSVAKIGPEPEGFLIMPSTVRLGSDRYLTTLRHKDLTTPGSIDAYLSEDAGHTWKFLGQAAPNIGGGNPPSLVLLKDGRLALIYGYRTVPYGIHARISTDQGHTWGKEIMLRDDAPTGDLEYPRSVQRPDGKIVSASYFNGPTDSDWTIQATIWKP
jgi:Neuraminidase (sialidase)